MARDGWVPGHWPTEMAVADYRKLVQMARRRLVGHEEHAEDVVSQAVLKWLRIDSGKHNVARIEQVIKTEAYSTLRSLHRSRERDTRATGDRALSGRGRDDDRAHALLRQALVQVARSEGIELTSFDVELLELLMAGFTQQQAAAVMGVDRHRVRRSRARWRRIVGRLEVGSLAEA